MEILRTFNGEDAALELRFGKEGLEGVTLAIIRSVALDHTQQGEVLREDLLDIGVLIMDLLRLWRLHHSKSKKSRRFYDPTPLKKLRCVFETYANSKSMSPWVVEAILGPPSLYEPLYGIHLLMNAEELDASMYHIYGPPQNISSSDFEPIKHPHGLRILLLHFYKICDGGHLTHLTHDTHSKYYDPHSKRYAALIDRMLEYCVSLSECCNRQMKVLIFILANARADDI